MRAQRASTPPSAPRDRSRGRERESSDPEQPDASDTDVDRDALCADARSTARWTAIDARTFTSAVRHREIQHARRCRSERSGNAAGRELRPAAMRRKSPTPMPVGHRAALTHPANRLRNFCPAAGDRLPSPKGSAHRLAFCPGTAGRPLRGSRSPAPGRHTQMDWSRARSLADQVSNSALSPVDPWRYLRIASARFISIARRATELDVSNPLALKDR